MCSMRSINLDNREELKSFLVSSFEISLTSASSFQCFGENTMTEFFEAIVSASETRADGLDRMWKIYQSHTTEILKTIFYVFTKFSLVYTLMALKPRYTLQSFKKGHLYSLAESSFFDRDTVFGLGLNPRQVKFVSFNCNG